jgi:hypothetical protein
MADSPKRPLGVTIIGILYLIVGLLTFLAGLGVLAIAALANPTDFEGWTQGAILALGGVVTVVGLINLILAAGCFKGWGWVWTLAFLFAFIDIILSIVVAYGQHFTTSALTTMVISFIFPLIIIWYLTKQNVKEFFGKA